MTLFKKSGCFEVKIKIKYIILKPNKPNPATEIPITAPPGKATFRASLKDFAACCAVLAFDFVATVIPIYPAVNEHKAPTINAPAVFLAIKINIIMAITKTKYAIIVYSRLRKAIAPV